MNTRRGGAYIPSAATEAKAENRNAPPPFLTKTYDLVDEAVSDPTISWGAEGQSFIVWKPAEFARDLLPMHFKHNNFSSFVRQLNTYGFRKVDPDRWEFANEHFLRGRRDLLGDIHRRKPTGGDRRPRTSGGGGGAGTSSHGLLHDGDGERQSVIEVGQYGLQVEVEQLKRDKNVLMQEVIRLRQQQQDSSEQMLDMQERLEVQEQRQQQMIGFLATALQHPGLVQHLVASNPMIKRIDDGRRRKKRKGAGAGGESDSDESDEMGSPGEDGQALTVTGPQQSLADLAQAFMSLLSTQDRGSKPRAGSRRGARNGDSGRRMNGAGPIIEEAPATSGSGPGGYANGNGTAAAAAAAGMQSMHHPVVVTSPGQVNGSAAAAAAAAVQPQRGASGAGPMVLTATPMTALEGMAAGGMLAPSAAAAAAFNAAVGAADFVPVPVPLPSRLPAGGVPLVLPPHTDANPIVELPELPDLGLGGSTCELDLADMLPLMSPATDHLMPAASDNASLGSDFWREVIGSPTVAAQLSISDQQQQQQQHAAMALAVAAVPQGMVPLDAAFPTQHI